MSVNTLDRDPDRRPPMCGLRQGSLPRGLIAVLGHHKLRWLAALVIVLLIATPQAGADLILSDADLTLEINTTNGGAVIATPLLMIFSDDGDDVKLCLDLNGTGLKVDTWYFNIKDDLIDDLDISHIVGSGQDASAIDIKTDKYPADGFGKFDSRLEFDPPLDATTKFKLSSIMGENLSPADFNFPSIQGGKPTNSFAAVKLNPGGFLSTEGAVAAVVPEPSGVALGMLGLLFLGCRPGRRRRRRVRKIR